MKNLYILFSLIFLISSSSLIAQEHNAQEESTHHEFKHFRAAFALGHAYIPEANLDNGRFTVFPTLGLELQYWINKKWGIALKSDVEIAHYSIEDDGVTIHRENPFILALPVLFSPWENGLSFIIGPGIELEEHENFSIFRFGVGYEFEIGNHWDFAPEFIYDLKNGHVNSVTLAIGIGKLF